LLFKWHVKNPFT